jgi:hypothetical protein
LRKCHWPGYPSGGVVPILDPQRPVMRLVVCLVAVCSLVAAGDSICLAQQVLGPPTLESLLGPETPAPTPVARPPALPVPASGEPKPPPEAVPAEAPVAEARGLVRQAFEDDYRSASGSPGALIEKLLATAGQTKDPARRYAMLLEAEQAALDAGDVGRAMSLIDARADAFAIDGVQVRIDALGRLLTPEARKSPERLVRLGDAALETAEIAARQDAPVPAQAAAELAEKVGKALAAVGRSQRNLVIVKDGDERQQQARDFAKAVGRRAELQADYRKAAAVLKDKPDDPAANGVVGRYLCFELGDWAAGLSALAKGDHKEFAETAALELRLQAAGKPDAGELFALAGKWWQAAEATGLAKEVAERVRGHAGTLYAKVAGELTDPLDKTLAAKRATLPSPAQAERPGSAPLEKGGLRDPHQQFALVTMPGPHTPAAHATPIPLAEGVGFWDSDRYRLSGIPAPLARGFVVLRGGNVQGNTTTFQVVSDGKVLMLLSGRPGGGGNSGGGWKENVTTPQQLEAQKWRAAGTVNLSDHPPCIIYVRDCRKGEAFTYSWEKYIPPALIIPADFKTTFPGVVE